MEEQNVQVEKKNNVDSPYSLQQVIFTNLQYELPLIAAPYGYNTAMFKTPYIIRKCDCDNLQILQLQDIRC